MTASAVYERVGIQLEAAADEVASLNNPLQDLATTSTLVTGRLGIAVHSVITESGEHTRSISGQLFDLATLAITRSRAGEETLIA